MTPENEIPYTHEAELSVCDICGKKVDKPEERVTTKSEVNGKTTLSTTVAKVICVYCTATKGKSIVIEKVNPK